MPPRIVSLLHLLGRNSDVRQRFHHHSSIVLEKWTVYRKEEGGKILYYVSRFYSSIPGICKEIGSVWADTRIDAMTKASSVVADDRAKESEAQRLLTTGE